LVRRIARLDDDARRREAVALGLADAVLERDRETLAAVLEALRDARARADDADLAGWLDAAIAFAHCGLERAPSHAGGVAGGTHAHEFLRALGGRPHVGSGDLREALGVDETQVSRTGRRLLEAGLVTRRKAGRQVFWALTPRGRQALADVPVVVAGSSNSEFWQEALRRGFVAAGGDEPGERREVDPTRERIVTCALELHGKQGIRATTSEQIADRAGVPVETVDDLFPTFDALTTSCAEHFLETLQLPPRELVPKVFAGASSETERIRRLVQTFFGAYERGADGITVGRRERDVPAAAASGAELEGTFDALIVEAVHPDSATLASLRALTDIEVWRTLRGHGATPVAAVEQASEAVERWLEAHPVR
jgi:AcrR family transcriptional regulator